MLHISQWLHTYMIARVSDGKKKLKTEWQVTLVYYSFKNVHLDYLKYKGFIYRVPVPFLDMVLG